MNASLVMWSLLTGCSTTHQGTYELTTTADASADSSALEDAEKLWEQRADAAQLEAALASYEAIWEASPSAEVAARLVRGYYFLGDVHREDVAEKGAAWNVSVDWGKQCLALNEGFSAAMAAGEKEETAIANASQDEVPCIYWMASALSKWAKNEGFTTLLKYKDMVKAFQSKVTELDPQYFNGGPDRYWGAYFAALPSFAGQDLSMSQTHFEETIKNHPDHLGNRVLYAAYWAEKSQNTEVFTEQLFQVLESDPTVLEGLEPEQRAEQEKARHMLETIGDRFVDVDAAAVAQQLADLDEAKAAEEAAAAKAAEEAAAAKAAEEAAAAKAAEEADGAEDKEESADETEKSE